MQKDNAMIHHFSPKAIAITIVIAMAYSLNAQVRCDECGKIRRNSDYYWAESPGKPYETFDEARKAALNVLVGNISQQIIATAKDTTYMKRTAAGIEATKEYERTLQSYSNVFMEDLTVIELSPEPECHVFVYVEKNKVRSIFEERKNQVTDFIQSGKYAEQDLQIDDALRFYYWALMLANTVPENIPVRIGDRTGNAMALLPAKIRSVLSAIKCTTVSSEENDYGENIVMLQFEYNGNKVASLRYKYFNGQSFAGPVIAKDGRGEAVILDTPPDGKMKINYEYRFQDEAKQLMPDVFSNIKPIIINESQQECALKNEKRKKKEKPAPVGIPEIKAEEVKSVTPLTRTKATSTKGYADAMAGIETAITKQNPSLAKKYMSDDCYKLFERLLTKSGKLALSKQKDKELEYIEANGEVLARYMYVTLKVNGGKTFMDKLVFRFSPTDGKIHSFAFGLTEKAENDIFDAAKNWSNISRYTILGFMEDYQTAFVLKRMDYIESIFSDDALIVIGHVLQPQQKKQADKIGGKLDSDQKVEYNTLTKQEYLKNLRQLFASNSYVHLSFEDNTTKTLNTGGVLPDGAAFGIQIKQMYNSSRYSDRGYLTLMLNMQGEHPMIMVRYWQPDKEPMVDMGKFFDKANFKW